MATPPAAPVDGVDSATLLTALKAFQRGDFSVRLPMNWVGMSGKIADTFNDIAENHAGKGFDKSWRQFGSFFNSE